MICYSSFQFAHEMHPIPSMMLQSPHEVVNCGIEHILAFFVRLLQPSIMNHFKQVTSMHVGIFFNGQDLQ
jgi:hypothetical protein